LSIQRLTKGGLAENLTQRGIKLDSCFLLHKFIHFGQIGSSPQQSPEIAVKLTLSLRLVENRSSPVDKWGNLGENLWRAWGKLDAQD
jgi:hypothetical protein